MSKTISARISNEVHEKLLEKCNTLGCNVNEYLNQHIESMVQDTSDKINVKSDMKTKSDDALKLVKHSDGNWETPDGVIVTEITESETKDSSKPTIIWNN